MTTSPQGRRISSSSRTRPANPSLSGSTSPTCTSAPTPSPRKPGAGRPLAVSLSRHHDRPRQQCGHGPRQAGRAGPRRQHHRHVRHRQRPPHEYLARRRHDPLPQREELQLGRGLPSARHGSVAGQDRARLGLQRDHVAPGLDAHPAGGRRRPGCQGEAPRRAFRPGTSPSGCISTATTSCRS